MRRQRLFGSMKSRAVTRVDRPTSQLLVGRIGPAHTFPHYAATQDMAEEMNTTILPEMPGQRKDNARPLGGHPGQTPARAWTPAAPGTIRQGRVACLPSGRYGVARPAIIKE